MKKKKKRSGIRVRRSITERYGLKSQLSADACGDDGSDDKKHQRVGKVTVFNFSSHARDVVTHSVMFSCAARPHAGKYKKDRADGIVIRCAKKWNRIFFMNASWQKRIPVKQQEQQPRNKMKTMQPDPIRPCERLKDKD